MKTIIRNAAAATLLSAVFASSAFAMSASSHSVAESLKQSNIDAQGLTISVSDGVVTLSGYTNDNLTRARAAQVAKSSEGVSKVINLVTGN